MKAKAYISEIGNLVGINVDPSFQKLIESISDDIELQDDAVAKSRNKVLVREQAVHDPLIIAHFKTDESKIKAEVYNGFDAKLKSVAESNGLTPEFISKMEAEKGTQNRMDMLFTELNTHLATKHKGADIDLEAIKKPLNQEIDRLKTDHQTAITQKVDELQTIKTKLQSQALNSYLSQYEYANGLNPTDGSMLAINDLNVRMTPEHLEFVYDYENNDISIKRKIGEDYQPYTDQTGNEPKTNEFIKQVLVNNNRIKVSEDGDKTPDGKPVIQLEAPKEAPNAATQLIDQANNDWIGHGSEQLSKLTE